MRRRADPAITYRSSPVHRVAGHLRGRDQALAAMERHSCAQRRHACAHSRQCCMLWRSHSCAQASQTSAHMVQIAFAHSLARPIAAAASSQAWAQSTSRAMQRASIFMFCSRRQDAAQWLQASAQAWQASMQVENFWWGMFSPVS
jgi:hypothetical protein